MENKGTVLYIGGFELPDKLNSGISSLEEKGQNEYR